MTWAFRHRVGRAEADGSPLHDEDADLLGVRAAALSEVPPGDDDWYMNLLWIERRKCLLLPAQL